MASRHTLFNLTRITVRHYSKRRAAALYRKALAERNPVLKERIMKEYQKELMSEESIYDRRHDEIRQEVEEEQNSRDGGFKFCVGGLIISFCLIVLARSA